MRKSTIIDKELVRELYLVATNTSSLYNGIRHSVQSLAKKKANGTFDKSKAAKAFRPTVLATIQWYKKNYGLGVVSDAEKMAICEQILEHNIGWINEQAKQLKKEKATKKRK